MKNRKSRVPAGCMAVVFALSLVLSTVDVQAGRKTKTFTDDFDNETVLGSYDSEIWSELGTGGTIKTAQLTEPDKVLEFKGKSANGENTVMMSLDWYWEVHELSFDIKVPESGSWFGLDFVDIDEPEDYLGDYAKRGEPMCYGSFKMSEEEDFGIPGTDWTYWGFSDKNIKGQWVSVKVVSEDEKTGKIYMAPRGKAFDKSKAQKITLGENRSFHNCNVVFTDYAFSGYMLDNIVIKTDTGTVRENFSDDKNEYFEAITFLEDTSVFSFSIVLEGAVRKLGFQGAKAADRLVANKAVLAEDKYLTSDEKVLDVVFSPDLQEAGADEEIAYVFGMADLGSEPFCGTWAYVMSKTRGKLVHYTEKGVEKVKASGVFGKTLSGEKIRITLTKGGRLEVRMNDRKILSYDGVNHYAGYTAFAAKTGIRHAIWIDDVTVSNHIYDVIRTKSFSDDFSKNRLGTSGNSDYEYYAESGSIQVSDGELAYEGCLDNSFFGPAYEYETYELNFKLTSILGTDDDSEKQNATAPDRWIGIDFGKQSATTKQYGTYGMFLIRITHPEGQKAKEWKTADTALWKLEGTSPLKGETFTQVKAVPASYFKDITYDGKEKMRDEIPAGAAVCFRLVAKENRMELYMKRADEKNYTLYVTVTDVNPAGWMGITCTGWTYWTLDDFSIKNTAKIYTKAPDVVIEEVQKVSLEERGLNVKDTGWAEEELLNQDKGTAVDPFVAAGVAAGILVILAAGTVSIVIRKKKKNRKQAGEGGEQPK